MDYPEIPCLFKRDEKGVLTRIVSHSYLGLVGAWKVTERITGVKTQVSWNGKCTNVKAEPKAGSGALIAWLMDKFNVSKMIEVFGPGSDRVTIFGTGWEDSPIYGPGVGFMFYDIYAGGRWLEINEWGPVRTGFEVHSTPEVQGYQATFPITIQVQEGMQSCAAQLHQDKDVDAKAVGVVCRTHPMLYKADGTRMMFKLDTADFPPESVLVGANGQQISQYGGRGS